MIKRTFYNLPAEKREKIIEVTRKEFRKGNKKKITINSVIKNAGISRGSFYQYFDDKLDLVELLTDDIIAKATTFVRDELTLSGGDIFAVPMRIFDIMTAGRGDYRDMLALSPSATNQNSGLISDYLQYRSHKPEIMGMLDGYINKSLFRDSSEDNIECVVFMLFDAIRAAMLNLNEYGSDVQKEKSLLAKKIQIIKSGAAV